MIVDQKEISTSSTCNHREIDEKWLNEEHRDSRNMSPPPVSTKRFSELRLAISEQMQTRNWPKLLEICGTSDSEESKSMAVIFSIHSPENIRLFVDFALRLSPEERRLKRNSIATICYALGRTGKPEVSHSLSSLRVFLSSDHMLKAPVEAALSNLWVLDPRVISAIIFQKWILQNREQNDDLFAVGISSCKYLFENSPEGVLPFLKKVAKLSKENPNFFACLGMVRDIFPELSVTENSVPIKKNARLGSRRTPKKHKHKQKEKRRKH